MTEVAIYLLQRLRAASANIPELRVIDFRRNYGQTAAIMAGIDYASGEIIIPIDADLQNDPGDIPALLAKLDEGFDVVSGWRQVRKDHAFRRNFFSRIANKIISWISGVHLKDYGCTLKAYRSDVLKDVRLYGEMHRFIPIYASWMGARTTEIAGSPPCSPVWLLEIWAGAHHESHSGSDGCEILGPALCQANICVRGIWVVHACHIVHIGGDGFVFEDIQGNIDDFDAIAPVDGAYVSGGIDELAYGFVGGNAGAHIFRKPRSGLLPCPRTDQLS